LSIGFGVNCYDVVQFMSAVGIALLNDLLNIALVALTFDVIA
jgi:hypothetical protein